MDLKPYSHRKIGRPIRAIGALLACAALLLGSLRAEDSATVANQVKSAFLFNFAKYVEWPAESFASKDAPLVVGIVGKDAIAGTIQETLSGKLVHGRAVLVRQVSDGADPGDCHLLFICPSEKKRVAKILETQKGRKVLTVSDMEQFQEEGGMISFRKEGPNIRFSIQQKLAEKAGLKISSKLLQLAKPGK
jgi:hypothetical protein